MNMFYWLGALLLVWVVWTFSLKIIDLRGILSMLKKS
jgi:hypothetical protein